MSMYMYLINVIIRWIECVRVDYNQLCQIIHGLCFLELGYGLHS